MKQAIKKKEFSKPSTSAIRSLLGFKNYDEKTPIKSSDIKTSSANKPMEFILMPKAFEEALKLPGIPQGYLTLVTGWSNTGKSTLKNCLIAACQRQGIMAVVYETENHFDWKYAMDCGVQAKPIIREVIDEETGEISEQVVDYEAEGVFVYNSPTIAEMYGDIDHSNGKRGSKKRKEPVLDDIAYSINEILDFQADGKIQQPICFIWDSVGSIQSYKSLTSKSSNNMFDAGAISEKFNSIINGRIPASKNIGEPYTNTFFCVNKIWNDSMNGMPGVPSIELKGGKSLFFGARLILHVGGVAKSAVKKLTATAKGETYNYGIITKVKVTKNQLPSPYNITYEGTMCCVNNGIISESDVDAYKKENIKAILNAIEMQRNKDGDNVEIAEGDVKFSEEETVD